MDPEPWPPDELPSAFSVDPLPPGLSGPVGCEPMKPNVTLAEATTPNGARMTLVEHDGSYCIRVNGQQLMHSLVATSEIKLGALACERHAGENLRPKALIGGLGLGFTLKSTLQAISANATVHVVELFPEIVEWNRTFLAALNGDALNDERVEVITEDVSAVIARSAQTPYDIIALDIDNNTTAMVKVENHQLYKELGIRKIWEALRPGGRTAIWFAAPDVAIERLLKKTGFAVQAIPARSFGSSKRETYMIYVADKPLTAGTRGHDLSAS